MLVGLFRSSGDSVNHDTLGLIKDVKEDTPVADANAMEVLFQLLDARGAWGFA